MTEMQDIRYDWNILEDWEVYEEGPTVTNSCGGGDRSFDLFDTILADCCIGRGGVRH